MLMGIVINHSIVSAKSNKAFSYNLAMPGSRYRPAGTKRGLTLEPSGQTVTSGLASSRSVIEFDE